MAVPPERVTGEPTATLSTRNWTVPVGTAVPVLTFLIATLRARLALDMPHAGLVADRTVFERASEAVGGGVTRFHLVARL